VFSGHLCSGVLNSSEILNYPTSAFENSPFITTTVIHHNIACGILAIVGGKNDEMSAMTLDDCLSLLFISRVISSLM